MDTYKVDHNGTYKSHPTKEQPEGVMYHYKMGVPVELPEEAAVALGDGAKKTNDPVPGKKEIKNPFNKMTGNNQTQTK